MHNYYAEYTLPADIWALAVTIWELYSPEKYLFWKDIDLGDAETSDSSSQGDINNQILRLYKILGKPGNKLWPNYIRNAPEWKTDRSRIDSGLPNEGMRHIINSILQYDAKNRPTAYEILKDPYFDHVRNRRNESNLTDCFLSHETRDLHVSENHLQGKKNIDEKVHTILFDWLMSITRMFKLLLRTYLYCSHLFDQVVTKINPSRTTAQLLGVACLSISAQICERYPPEPNDYIYICDGAYKMNQLNEMRLLILKACNFDLLLTVSYDYYEMAEIMGLNPVAWAVAQSLMTIITMNSLRETLFPKEQFKLCVGLAAKYIRLTTPSHLSP